MSKQMRKERREDSMFILLKSNTKPIKCILLMSMLMVLLITTAHAGHPWEDHGKLEVSKNKRYLQHEDGTPFFWFGDTCWEASHRATSSMANTYYQNRADKGVTVVHITVHGSSRIDIFKYPNACNMINGLEPFVDKDPTQPREEFYSHIDTLVSNAANYGLYIGLLPTWGEYVCQAWGKGPEIFNEDNAGTYGAWIGNRYKDHPNIIWIIGGDRYGDHGGAGDLAIWRAMANGIKSVDPNHIMTYHTCSDQANHVGLSSSDWFHNDSWLDFNMIQTHVYIDTIPSTVNDDYTKPLIKPTILGEGVYYGWDPLVSDRVYRSQPYWAFLAGSCGYTFGQTYIWWCERKDDGNDGTYYTKNYPEPDEDENWLDYLDNSHTIWMENCMDFFKSIDWWKLIPDQSVITAGAGSGDDQKVASRTSTGNMVVVYYATISSATIDMSKITSGSKAVAKWWNPVNKSEKVDGTYSTSGTRSFTPPASWEDAVLVITAVTTKPFLIAHRGGKQWAPENTLTAFQKCAENGINFETDLRMTSDGEIVLMHDATIDRTTDGTGNVANISLADLKKLDASDELKWNGTEYDNIGLEIPTFTELLDFFDMYAPAGVILSFDTVVYTSQMYDEIISEIQSRNLFDRVYFEIVQDTSQLDAVRARQGGDNIQFAIWVGTDGSRFDFAIGNPYIDRIHVSPDIANLADKVSHAHANDKIITLHLIETPAEYDTMIGYGADGMMGNTDMLMWEHDNNIPEIGILSPGDNAELNEGEDIVILAEVSDSDDSITKVEFYKDGTYLGQDASRPYEHTWVTPPEGTYSLTVKVYDNGQTKISSPAVVDVE